MVLTQSSLFTMIIYNFCRSNSVILGDIYNISIISVIPTLSMMLLRYLDDNTTTDKLQFAHDMNYLYTPIIGCISQYLLETIWGKPHSKLSYLLTIILGTYWYYLPNVCLGFTSILILFFILIIVADNIV